VLRIPDRNNVFSSGVASRSSSGSIPSSRPKPRSELADEGIDLTDTVLSNTRDQIEGTVLVLGRTAAGDFTKLVPLNYPPCNPAR
jgi:hypothetical protein